MLFLSVAQDYLFWHYSRAFREFFHVWMNLLWFVVHFFSLPQLTRSWFAPWKRITEGRGNTWSFEDLAGYLIIGLLSRLVGFIMRTAIILIGLICLLTLTIIGFVIYIFWVAAPLAVIGMLGFGLSLVLSSILIHL